MAPDLTLADIRAKYQDKLFPAPSTELSPYFAGPGRKAAQPRQSSPRPAPEPSPAASLTAEQILAAYDRRGSWGEAARDLDVTEYHLRDRRNQLGLHVRPKHRVSDEKILAAYAEHGSYELTAAALGIASGGSFSRRLKAALAR